MLKGKSRNKALEKSVPTLFVLFGIMCRNRACDPINGGGVPFQAEVKGGILRKNTYSKGITAGCET